MVDQALSSAPALLAAILAGYLIGALPLAQRLSRWQGVDIFSAGSGLAGASNVRRSVGKTPALIVLIGDMAKGALAVAAGSLLGLEGIGLLVPAAASVVGHWRSVFSGFRGGDGLATLGGAAIPLFGTIGVVSAMVAMLIALGGQKLPYPSLLSVVIGYGTLVVLIAYVDGDTRLALGFGGLSALVLAYAIDGHRRRRHIPDWDDIDDTEGMTEKRGF